MKNPDRHRLRRLSELPNIGPAIEQHLGKIGITRPQQLISADPYALYDRLCASAGRRYDPCMLDVLIASVDFMNGGDPAPWWTYTRARKQRMAR